MSKNKFEEIRARAQGTSGFVKVTSIQVGYTASGDGSRFCQFMLNNEIFFEVDPADTASLIQIGYALTVLGQKRSVSAVVQDQKLLSLVTD